MFVAKIKLTALMIFLAATLVAGGVLSHTLTAVPQAETKAKDPPPKQKVADKPEAKPIRVKVVTAKAGGLARTADAYGHLIAYQQQQLVPLISGTIQEVLVDIGDRVKKGQTLIVLDAPLIAKEWEQATSAFEMAQAEEQEAKARIVTTEAEVEAAEALRIVREAEKDMAIAARIAAQAVLKRLKKLDKSVVSERQLHEAASKVAAVEAQVKAAEATIAAARADVKIKKGKLAHAKAALKLANAAARTAHAVMDKARIQESFTQIKAAFDGVVTRRTADPGNFVQASDSRLLTPLLTLQHSDRLRFRADLAVRAAPFIGRGDPVDLNIDDLPPAVRLPAQKIARFIPTVNGPQKKMTVEIDVANPDGRLMAGMSGWGKIHFKKRPKTALVVPRSCLLVRSLPTQPSYTYAVYIVRDGKAHGTRIEIAAKDEKNAEISEGVKASDLIVTEPKDLKGDMVPVEITKEP